MRRFLASVLLVLCLAGCKEKLTSARAKELVTDYIKTHQGTSITVSTPDLSQVLDQETEVNYKTVPRAGTWTRENRLVMELAKTGLADMTSRVVTLQDVRGEYDKVSGPCSYHISISTQYGETLQGSVTYMNSLYRTCDWGPFHANMSGNITESGSVQLELPGTMSNSRCQFALAEGTLRPVGGSNINTCQAQYRRTTTEAPPVTITKYRYSITDRAKAMGLMPNGGDVKIGETVVDDVTDLLLHGETNATGRAAISARYNQLRATLAPDRQERGAVGVSFGQTTEGKWVVVSLE